MRAFFEMIPVFLAITSAILCSMKYSKERRTRTKAIMLIGIVCSVLLLIAQLSWWTSVVIQGNTYDASKFADILWTMYNNLTMMAFIVASYPRGETK